MTMENQFLASRNVIAAGATKTATPAGTAITTPNAPNNALQDASIALPVIASTLEICAN